MADSSPIGSNESRTKEEIDPALLALQATVERKRAELPPKPVALKSVPVNTLKPHLSFQSSTDDELEERQAAEEARKRAGRVQAMLAKAGIFDRHTAVPEGEASEKQVEQQNRIIATFRTGAIFAVLGDRGTGKSQIAANVIRAAANAERRPLYTTAQNIFRSIRVSMRSDSKENEVEAIKAFTSPALLVIDEAHERGNSDFEDRTLVEIIDERYGMLRETILIANLTAIKFAEAVGPSIISRIQESGGIIECTAAKGWKNYRRGGK